MSPLRPNWDGITAWGLILTALLLAGFGYGDGRFNGLELLAAIAWTAGVALLVLVVHDRGRDAS